MARRRTSERAAPEAMISGAQRNHKKSAFAEWIERESLDAYQLADELGITASYVRLLKKGSVSPGAKLRLRIQERSGGVVRFDSW